MATCSTGGSSFQPNGLVEAFHGIPHVDINLDDVSDAFAPNIDYFQVRRTYNYTPPVYTAVGCDNMGLRSSAGGRVPVHTNVRLLHRRVLLLLLPSQEESFKVCQVLLRLLCEPGHNIVLVSGWPLSKGLSRAFVVAYWLPVCTQSSSWMTTCPGPWTRQSLCNKC